MYNKSIFRRSVCLQKTAKRIRDCELPSGSRLENGLGCWVQHRGGNKQMTTSSDVI